MGARSMPRLPASHLSHASLETSKPRPSLSLSQSSSQPNCWWHRLAKRARAAGSGRIDVLNGIAFNPATSSIWVTGKKWPKIYEISVVEVPEGQEDFQQRLERTRQQCIK